MTITSKSSATIIPISAATKPNAKGAFDKSKQEWLGRIALDHELPAGALRLCIVVSNYMSRALGGEAWPSMALLATKTGLSRHGLSSLPDWLSNAAIGLLPEANPAAGIS